MNLNKSTHSNDKEKSTPTWVYVAAFLTIIVLLCGFVEYRTIEKEKQINQEINQEINQKYQLALESAHKGDWSECSFIISSYVNASELMKGNVKKNTEKKSVLYLYSQAQISLGYAHYSEANRLLDLIDSENYKGEFDQAIIDLKVKTLPPLLEVEKHADQERKMLEEEKLKAEQEQKPAERASKLYIGDDESKIFQIMGEPYDINRTVIGADIHKQYVYWRDNKPVCIYTENGIITAFQD